MKNKLILYLVTIFSLHLQAQNVQISGAVTGNGSYATVGAAFNAINAGTQTNANITILIVNNTTETTNATLNAGAWSQLTITPSGGSARTISGNTSGGLLHFNGADNVIMNGLNSGGNSLTITNAATSSASTILLSNDASNNIFDRLTLKGSSGSIVEISTGTTTGNDNNSFFSNTLTPEGTTSPTNGFFSLGSSATIENNNNTINNSIIRDIFNGASTSSAAITISSHNSGWSILNNKIFNTSPYTASSATTNYGILISSGTGYTLTNNVIGYANELSSGTMTLSSTADFRFVGIQANFGSSGTNDITGNLVSNISLTTGSTANTGLGALCGVAVLTGNANINNNFIGFFIGTGSLSLITNTGSAALVGIYSASTGTTTIQNNNLGAINNTNNSPSIGGTIIGINVAGVATSVNVSNNTIGNSEASNIRAGISGTTMGISAVVGIAFTATPTTATVHNNTVQNLSSFGTGVASLVRGITTLGATGSSSTFTITNNQVSSLTTNSASPTVVNGLTSAAGIVVGVGTNNLVSGNQISFISNTNTGTGAYHVVGIGLSNATNTTVSKNIIHNLSNAGTSTSANGPAVVAGIFIRTGTSNVDVINNMIALGSGQTTNTAFVGIQGNFGSTPNPTCNIHFNSIHISGTAASGAQPSFGIARTDFSATAKTPTMNIKNNIIVNVRNGGAGGHFAIANNYGATASATGWVADASDRNVLNAAAGTIGWWTTAQTFSGWKTNAASDNGSFSNVTVNFVDPGTGDLHLNMGVTPTVIESSGLPIAGINDDIDGQTRPGPAGSVNGGAGAPDLGADETDAVPADLLPPTISYTPLPPSCTLGSRTLTATITDFSGVPTSGAGLPVLYWRVNLGAYTAATGVSIGGNQYEFTFGGTATSGDQVFYYVVAQDLQTTPNVISSPFTGAAGLTANPPAASTPPSTPNNYTINALSGTFNVGIGEPYTTLTAAVNAYNNACLTGPVVFNLMDATYPSETFPITINHNPTASTTNTLTIKPNTMTTLSGSNAAAILLLNGADYVTINGDPDGGDPAGGDIGTLCDPGGDASLRQLTIENTSNVTSSVVVALITSTQGNPATNNKIINTIVKGASNTTTSVGINISGPNIGSGSGSNFNNFNVINNNKIIKCVNGIFSAGSNIGSKNTGNKYCSNAIDGSVASGDALTRIGILILFEDAPMIQKNKIANIVSAGSTDAVAIAVGNNNFRIPLSSGAETSNADISNNLIDNIQQSNTFSAIGISVGITVSGTTTIRNNMISNVYAKGTSDDLGAGILVGGGTGSTNVYHNSVRMSHTTAYTGGTYPNVAFALSSLTVNPNVNVKNNIFVSDGPGNGSTINNVAFGIHINGPYTNIVSDNNLLHVAGSGSHVGVVGTVNAGTTYTTLLNWQTGVSKDLASQSVLPTFVASNNLHLSNLPGDNWCLKATGDPSIGVPEDIDCTTRITAPYIKPDIGADEFDATGFVVNNPAITCQSNTVDLTEAAVTAGSIAGLTFSYWNNINGTIPLVTPSAVATAGTYYISANNAGCSLILPVTVSFNPAPNAVNLTPPPPAACGSLVALVATGGQLGGNPSPITWTPATGLFTDAAGTIAYTAGTNATTVYAAAGTVPVYTATATSIAGCTSSSDVIVPLSNAGALPISIHADAAAYPLGGSTTFIANCRAIATVSPANMGGASGVLSANTALVPPGLNGGVLGEPFGPRRTTLTPAINGAATVNLYFTQQDFTNYNNHVTNNNYPYTLLPAANSDPTTYVRIRQYTGTMPNYSSLAGSVLLVPTSVIWDAAGNNGNGWWVVTVEVTGFSTFFLTSVSLALPITLADLNARVTGATNTVLWTTVTEVNSSKFIVERSIGGIGFAAIGELPSQALGGNSNVELDYSFEDIRPVPGKQYYRLKMVDNDGSSQYSPIVTVEREADKFAVTEIRPNPTSGMVDFTVVGASDELSITVRNLQGQALIRKNLTSAQSGSIDLSNFANGVYVLEATDTITGAKIVYKLVKQ
jgi:trimeric autotransporter adhesin